MYFYDYLNHFLRLNFVFKENKRTNPREKWNDSQTNIGC